MVWFFDVVIKNVKVTMLNDPSTIKDKKTYDVFIQIDFGKYRKFETPSQPWSPSSGVAFHNTILQWTDWDSKFRYPTMYGNTFFAKRMIIKFKHRRYKGVVIDSLASTTIDFHTVACGPTKYKLALLDKFGKTFGTIDFDIHMTQICSDLMINIRDIDATSLGIHEMNTMDPVYRESKTGVPEHMFPLQSYTLRMEYIDPGYRTLVEEIRALSSQPNKISQLQIKHARSLHQLRKACIRLTFILNGTSNKIFEYATCLIPVMFNFHYDASTSFICEPFLFNEQCQFSTHNWPQCTDKDILNALSVPPSTIMPSSSLADDDNNNNNNNNNNDNRQGHGNQLSDRQSKILTCTIGLINGPELSQMKDGLCTYKGIMQGKFYFGFIKPSMNLIDVNFASIIGSSSISKTELSNIIEATPWIIKHLQLKRQFRIPSGFENKKFKRELLYNHEQLKMIDNSSARKLIGSNESNDNSISKSKSKIFNDGWNKKSQNEVEPIAKSMYSPYTSTNKVNAKLNNHTHHQRSHTLMNPQHKISNNKNHGNCHSRKTASSPLIDSFIFSDQDKDTHYQFMEKLQTEAENDMYDTFMVMMQSFKDRTNELSKQKWYDKQKNMYHNIQSKYEEKCARAQFLIGENLIDNFECHVI